MIKKSTFIIIFFGLHIIAWSQNLTDSVLSLHEDSLLVLYSKISKDQTDDSNQINSLQFESKLSQLLNDKASLHFGFERLKQHFGILTSDNNFLRIYNWNILLKNGTYSYNCWLQYYSEEKDKIFVYQLKNKADSISEIETTPSSIDAWFGCLYYQIIETQDKGKTVYTLLGWNGHTLFTNRKLIETLMFSDSGKAIFGKTVLQFGKVKKRRAVFEYSERSSMTLRYEPKLETIVFDHLSPTSEVYKNHPEYYGSDFSYDGLVFNDGAWNYVTDVDIRNIKPPKKEKHKKAIREKQP